MEKDRVRSELLETFIIGTEIETVPAASLSIRATEEVNYWSEKRERWENREALEDIYGKDYYEIFVEVLRAAERVAGRRKKRVVEGKEVIHKRFEINNGAFIDYCKSKDII